MKTSERTNKQQKCRLSGNRTIRFLGFTGHVMGERITEAFYAFGILHLHDHKTVKSSGIHKIFEVVEWQSDYQYQSLFEVFTEAFYTFRIPACKSLQDNQNALCIKSKFTLHSYKTVSFWVFTRHVWELLNDNQIVNVRVIDKKIYVKNIVKKNDQNILKYCHYISICVTNWANIIEAWLKKQHLTGLIVLI